METTQEEQDITDLEEALDRKKSRQQIFDWANKNLIDRIPRKEIERVFSGDVDIDLSFLGFVDTYKLLSYIIPESHIVIDLGCGYNPQSYFFTNHKKYIAVDLPAPITRDIRRFKTDNCTILEMSIEKFMDTEALAFDPCFTFAICNYVPCGMDVRRRITERFPNLYSFYPPGEANTLSLVGNSK